MWFFLTVDMIMPIKWIFGIQMSWNPLLWVSFCVHTNCRISPAPKSWLSGSFVLSCYKHLLSKTLCYQRVSLYDCCNGDIIPYSYLSLCITIYTNIYCSAPGPVLAAEKNAADPSVIAGPFPLFSLSPNLPHQPHQPHLLENIGLIA